MNSRDTWAMYFAGIVAFQTHPRNDKEVDLEYCAYLADEMMIITGRRFQWAGSDQQSQQSHKSPQPHSDHKHKAT